MSIASDGAEANADSFGHSISADGRFVAYHSFASNLVPGDTNDAQDIFVFDRKTDTTTRVSVANDGTEANADSLRPSISANGRFVAYDSLASNLVPGDTNNVFDVFVVQTRPTRDREDDDNREDDDTNDNANVFEVQTHQLHDWLI